MRLFFRKYGEGFPIIILHGLFGSSDNWVTIAKSLSDMFTVILPDQRNHGLSPWSAIHDYDSLSDDILDLVQDLRLEKFFLAGHSMGGKCAVNFALKWPELLMGLLVADISPFSPGSEHHTEYLQHSEILNTIISTDLSNLHTRREIDSLFAAKLPSERIRGLILKNIQRNPDSSFSWRLNAPALLKNIDHLMEAIKIPASADLPLTGFPVIFLRGLNSDYLPPSDFDKILKIFPAAEFTDIPDAGHWVHADNPEAVRESIIRLKHMAS